MRVRLALCAVLLACGLAQAEPAATAAGGGETVQQALCRLIESAARSHGLPVEFFTRLIWRESSFRTGVVSPAGAQGVAQFMPRTAAERGLADPFDPEAAIPHSAAFLAELRQRFGNLGLAAAAYNGGPTRVANWLEGRGGLPAETQSYVFLITRRSAEDWAAYAKGEGEAPAMENAVPQSCLQVTAALRRPSRDEPDFALPLAPIAPWGVQLAGNFSKERALASFARARRSYAALLGDIQPMIIGTRLRSRGTRAFYRVRVPATTRNAADALCNKIRGVGGSCVALRS
jgi:hypothetical protein